MRRKELIIFISTIIIFASIIFLLSIFKLEVELTIGIIGFAVTAFFGLLKQNIEHDKMFKELFESLNERYNNKTNDMFNNLRRDNLMKISDIKNGHNKIIDYFNLCGEEYLWYSRGRIPKKVWKAWKHGILENINIPEVKELYIKEMQVNEVSYYGLVKELKLKITK